MDANPIVSIVVPTFNRFVRLRRCIDKIRHNVAPRHEIVVVDGGSTDGAREWLQEQADEIVPHDVACGSVARARVPGSTASSVLRVVLEPDREGAVRAFNKGFRTAVGDYVMWLNDDAYPMPGAVVAAIDMIERPDLADVGMVAFYHNWQSERNVLDAVEFEGKSYQLCNVRGYPYANFGLLRRTLLERIGYADERYHFFAFDPDLSLTIQIKEGLKVIGCRQALIAHEEFHDDRKLDDLDAGAEDNAKLFAKWDLPEKDSYPDPSPAYRKMLAERRIP